MRSYAERFSIRSADGAQPPDLRWQMVVADLHEGRIGHVHGGSIAGLLELAAIRHAEHAVGIQRRPMPITMTIDFRRGAPMIDIFANARSCSQTRRLLIVDAVAWQTDPQKPIATAHVHFALDNDQAALPSQ